MTVVVLLWQAGAVESEIFDLRGVSIRYLVDGAGEPVVLIHELYSSARINWQLPGTLAALAVDHQVDALDLPGFGRSGKPDFIAEHPDRVLSGTLGGMGWPRRRWTTKDLGVL